MPSSSYLCHFLRNVCLFSLVANILFIEGFTKDQYVGCFYENSSPLLQWEDTFNMSSMTIELCIEHCRTSGGKTYAKLQNGSVCQCGDDYGVQTLDRACHVICSGNPSEYCGGVTNELLTTYVLYTVCPIGNYSTLCDRVCHCKRQIPCDRETGLCANGCDGNYTGSNCNTTKTSSKYIGCFQDDSGRPLAERPLPNRAHNPDNYFDDWQKVTIDVCIGWCSDVFSTFAGAQYGAECYCGESYNKFGQLNESACSSECQANRAENCGGPNANSVYSVCPAGNFGNGCSRKCNCVDNGRCVYLTGSCISSSCKPGWTGTSCNFRDCAVANGDCSTYETCLSVDLKFTNTSVCRCSAGFQKGRLWQNCTDIDECTMTPSVCGKGSANCTNTVGGYRCHCENGQTTDNQICAKAASNTNGGTTGEKTATIIGAVVGSVCGVLVILVIIIAVVCYRRKRCKTPPTEASPTQPNVKGAEPELQYSSLAQRSDQPNTDYDKLDVNAYEEVDSQEQRES